MRRDITKARLRALGIEHEWAVAGLSCAVVLVLGAVADAAASLLVMVMWDLALPAMVRAPAIGFWPAFGLLNLVAILAGLVSSAFNRKE